MTKVIRLTSSRAGTRVHSSAHQPTLSTTTAAPATFDPVTRQQDIENALSMALYFIRQPGITAANVWAATARANRALTLLKQASQGNALASTANTLGRA
jgi:hypothetical protein